MKRSPLLIPLVSLIAIGISFWLISLPSDLEQFQERCEQQYIVGEGRGKFDTHGQNLCNCLAVNLSQELKSGAFRITSEIFEHLAQKNDSALDSAIKKLEKKNPTARIKFEEILGYCHPHMGPVPDTASIAKSDNEPIIGVGAFCLKQSYCEENKVCNPKGIISAENQRARRHSHLVGGSDGAGSKQT